MRTVHITKPITGAFELPGSKSASNRALVLQALFPNIAIEGLSAADDTQLLAAALQKKTNIIDVGPAGTAMRFATAFLAHQTGTFELRGTERMHQRPIKPLVEALRQLGADIEYLEKPGFPPLRITGKNLQGTEVSIDTHLSSQFTTALMLLGLALPNGLTINLRGPQISAGYVSLTAKMCTDLGFDVEVLPHQIQVKPAAASHSGTIKIEKDWSAAVFAYTLVALQPGASLWLPDLTYPSAQPDAKVVEIYEALGVHSQVLPEGIRITQRGTAAGRLEINCQLFPDMAQGLAVAMAGLGVAGSLFGLDTLRIKETDRIAALAVELAKFGIEVPTTANSISFSGGAIQAPKAPIKTYEDHRMAMAFACLSPLFPVTIEHPEVVSKSFPGFWDFFNAFA